jgi:hypothetical protein
VFDIIFMRRNEAMKTRLASASALAVASIFFAAPSLPALANAVAPFPQAESLIGVRHGNVPTGLAGAAQRCSLDVVRRGDLVDVTVSVGGRKPSFKGIPLSELNQKIAVDTDWRARNDKDFSARLVSVSYYRATPLGATLPGEASSLGGQSEQALIATWHDGNLRSVYIQSETDLGGFVDIAGRSAEQCDFAP